MAASTTDANREEDFGTDSSMSDQLDMHDEDGWEDVDNDEISETFTSLFDDKNFSNILEMLQYCKTEHHFDIWQLQKLHGLDFLGLVRLVNYVRKEVSKGTAQPDVSTKSLFDDELYLLPTMEDDAVLHNLEEILQSARDTATNEVEELKDQLSSLRAQFDAYKNDVEQYLSRKEPEMLNLSATQVEDSPAALASVPDNDTDYFKSYSYNAIHESMLKDKVRTDAYRDFIYDNKDLFKGKTVLDVGCGTGILSMFCAKAGARQVIAVDNSDIISQARKIIRDNQLDDRIQCIRGKIEDVQLPCSKVDIIVSEWMGYCLLYESMLDSVLFARDKYLVEGGLMIPSHATINLAPLSDSELHISYIDFWKDVYGFDMRHMLEKAHEEIIVHVVEETAIAAESQTLLVLDLHRIKSSQLNFTSSFDFQVKDGFDVLEGFAIWFDIYFARTSEVIQLSELSMDRAREKKLLAFTTGPAGKATHWQQGVCLIPDATERLARDIKISGKVMFNKRQQYSRALDVNVSWQTGEGIQQAASWFIA